MDTAIQALKTAVEAAGPSARDQVLHSLNQLIVSIEEPIDALNKLAGCHLGGAAATMAVESGLFKLLAESKEPLSAEQIARKLSTAPGFTSHLLRYLAAIGHVKEVDQDRWAANKKTEAFAQAGWEGGIQHYFGTIAPAIQVYPEFMKKRNYQDVTESAETAFQIAHNTKLPAFDWLPSAQPNMKWFMEFMQVQRIGYVDWLSVFPMDTELGNWNPPKDSDAALFVDVGGAFGSQAINFHQKYNHLPGRVIVQDVGPVVEMAQLPPPIEKMAINFFEGQPVKGAKFYYMRNIMHDHPDSRCVIILKHIVSVMGPDSVILIDDMCLPAKGAPQVATSLDMIMISCLAAVERTYEQWQSLMDAAGLMIRNSYKYTTSLADTIIVAVPKRDHHL